MKLWQLKGRIKEFRQNIGKIEDRHTISAINFLTEALETIIAEIEQSKEDARYASNVASCLANGIMPD